MDKQRGLKHVRGRWELTAAEVNDLPLQYRPSILHLPGYGTLIRVYVQFLLAKLRFHRLRPEFNGLFDYDEYVTLKGIDDPNEGYVHFPSDLYTSTNFST